MIRSFSATRVFHVFTLAMMCGFLTALLVSCSAPSPSNDRVTSAPSSSVSSRNETDKAFDPAFDMDESLEKEAIRSGKENVTVLVLNGCGVEGAAQEVAEKLKAQGYARVTTENATYFNSGVTRVSYRHEEQRAEVDEIAELLEVTGRGNVYNYGNTKDWGLQYDILVMVGDPSAAGNPIFVG